SAASSSVGNTTPRTSSASYSSLASLSSSGDFEIGSSHQRHPATVLVTSLRPSHQPAGRGAYAIRALPDVCLGIRSGGASEHCWIPFRSLKPRHARGFLCLSVHRGGSAGPN